MPGGYATTRAPGTKTRSSNSNFDNDDVGSTVFNMHQDYVIQGTLSDSTNFDSEASSSDTWTLTDDYWIVYGMYNLLKAKLDALLAIGIIPPKDGLKTNYYKGWIQPGKTWNPNSTHHDCA